MKQRDHGFTYLMVLWWVAISSVMLAAMAQNWQTESRREKEKELAFKGAQIRQAIEAFSRRTPSQGGARLPRDWHELLADRRDGQVVRHLRQAWLDPMTGKPWGEIRADGYLKGVFSEAKGRPLTAPQGLDSYPSWRFEPGQTAATGP
jgi:type II secretory pathway component PulK